MRTDGSVQPGQRRAARHEETREAIVALAVEIMGTEGVAGLTLGEVARRLGVRTPSLYTYFPSKNALYDELFRRGWTAARAHLVAAAAELGDLSQHTDVVARGAALQEVNTRWAIDHPALTQLMMFRPLPAYEPSAEAYAASGEYFAFVVAEVDAYARLGLLRAGVDPAEVVENLASVGAGVISRHLANEPGVPFDLGRATRHLRSLVTAVVTSYLPLDS